MAWNKDLNFKEEIDKTSRINAAGIINITLENLWKEGYSYLVNGDYVKWNRKLDSIWLILGGDVSPGSSEEKEFMKIDTQLYSLGNLGHQKIGFETTSQEDKGKRATQYLVLRNKSLFLRRLQNKQGKGTAYTDSEYDDFD